MLDIRLYLEDLRLALGPSDAALVQDALAETETSYRRERARLAWAEPLLPEPEAAAKALARLGPPEQRAEAYRQRERSVDAVLAPPLEPDPPARPWPSFLGVFLDAKAYTSILYLLAGIITGTFYFTWVVTGLALSAGLLVLVIGVPVLVLFLGSVRALGLGEGRLVEALLDVRMPRRPPLLPEGRGWLERLKTLFTDSYTWKCLVYLSLHLPLALCTFTLILLGLSVSLGLVAAPVARGIWGVPVLCLEGSVYDVPLWLAILMPIGGALGLAGTLHLGLALGRLHGSLAKVLLVRR